MSITAADPQTQAFDVSEYDLEGTPILNGRKATTVTVSFEAFDLDTTDAQHMTLADLIRKGGTFSITMTARVTKRSWLERETLEGEAEVGRRYTLTLRDIAT